MTDFTTHPSCRGLRPTGSQHCGGEVSRATANGLVACIKCGRAYSSTEIRVLRQFDEFDAKRAQEQAERRKADAAARAKGKKRVPA